MKQGLFWVLVATVVFSSMEIAIKLTAGAFHPLQLNFLRFFLGGLFLLPIGHLQNHGLPLRLPTFAYGFYALTGFVFAVVSMSLFTLSLTYASAATVAILFSANAFFAIIIAALFFRQKISRLTVGALALCGIGLVFIINPFELHDRPRGIFLALLCALVFAVYANMIKYSQKHIRYGGLVPTAYTFLFGSGEILLLIGIGRIAPVGEWLRRHGGNGFVDIPVFGGISSDNILLLLYIALVVSGLGFAAYSFAIETASMTLASLTFLLKPVVAPIFAFIILGDRQPPPAILGIVVLASGSLLLALENSSRGHRLPLPDLLRQKILPRLRK